MNAGLVGRARSKLARMARTPRGRRASNAFDRLRGAGEKPSGEVRWLFVATFPNGGSTALAQLLVTARKAVKLTDAGEGQWLVDHLSGPDRWNPDLPVDWRTVRAVWLRKLREMGVGSCVVIEKSPPNMVRMAALREALDDMPSQYVVYTRDPYAVCSSWGSRYHKADLRTDGSSNAALYGDIAKRYGNLAETLADLLDGAAYAFSYEELTGDTQAVLERLRALEPFLDDIDMEAKLKVKDHAPQPLVNMNERQIASLHEDDIAAITATLVPHEAAVNRLGYELRR